MQESLRVLIRGKQIYDAWLLLRGEFRSSLDRFVRRTTGPENVEMICQSVWNDVYQALPSYPETRVCSSWLLALAQARLDVGRRAVEPRSAARALFARAATERHPMNRRDIPELERVIATLPRSERELLELHYINELDPEEIGSFIGASTRRVAHDLRSIVVGLLGGKAGLRSPRTRRVRRA